MTTFERLVIRALLILIKDKYVPGTTPDMGVTEYLKISGSRWATETYPKIVAWETDAADALAPPPADRNP